MKLAFGSEPSIEDYEALMCQRDELLAKHDACDNELKSAKELSEKWMGKYLQRQQEAREQFDAVRSEIEELKSSVKEKQFDLAEMIDDGIAYRAACDNEFSEFYDGESLSPDEKLTLLKSDVRELAKEKAASIERAALSELLSDIHELSETLNSQLDTNPITSEMVSEGLRGIKELDAKAREAFSDIYRDRASDLRTVIDSCWTLAKELAELCPKNGFKPKKVSDFSNNLGQKIKEAHRTACDVTPCDVTAMERGLVSW